MKKFYYLRTCDTCSRIMKELELPQEVELREIKSDPVTSEELQQMHDLTKSYEALFNKRARLYRERNLKEKNLEETDYKNLILEEYTFLKRPVLIIDDQIFVGNSKKTVAAARQALSS
ncbi:arsenate reductase family protein [Robertkochia aurantiaca]|uniref:arsenate reductase family protein n=1 Tax=Robertkochia aurantiaca TaxID=2873700 RepID=UPI001CCCB008|nr:ArsC/Spx/MgsR family protein [Robertkochia sp. 3YJGBD-33]